jgi:hypothetical protein
MVTLNKIIVGISWKWTFWACNFQTFLGEGRAPQALESSWRPTSSQYQSPPHRKIAYIYNRCAKC